jgi:SAM-dependent methyltransferase
MACPLCRGTSSRVLAGSTLMVRSAYEGASVVRCQDCGLDHVDPLPAKLEDVYEEDYFRAYQDAGMVFPTEAVLHPRYAARLRAVERARGRGRLLEIGVGHGGFLHHAAERGWDTTGVELSRYAAAYVKQRYGLNVLCGSIESADLPEASYDMIHLSHVVEHLLDPVAALRRIRTLLSPTGVLAIEVPNELENLHVRARRLIGAVRPYPVQCTHICFFIPSTLRQLLERAGYRLTGITTLRDETDRQPLRRLAKRAAGAIEKPLGLGPLIEAFATRADDRGHWSTHGQA